MLADIIIIAVIAAISWLCIRKIVKGRKTGSSGCSGDCSCCGGACHNSSVSTKKS